MAKTKRILAFVSAVMILFTLSLGFAGCKDEEEEKITYMIYLCDSDNRPLSSVVNGQIRGVSLLCELKDGDDKEMTLSYDEVAGYYICIRYMKPDDDYTLFTCYGQRYYKRTFWPPDGEQPDKAPKTLERGVFIYRCMDQYYDDPRDYFFAQLRLEII